MEFNQKYQCEHFMITNGGNHVKKNDRNSHLFLKNKVIFEYGKKKSYLTSQGNRSSFTYIQNIDGGEVYTSDTTSALLVIGQKITQVVAGNFTMSYGCIK